MERHKQAVTRIASSVRAFFDRKEPYRIFHGSTNSTRPFRRDRFVDISALNNVLEVNKARRIALVEPNVPMDRLVENTLRHGLIPPVVMEFPGITAGGGYAGTAGESSSFKHGFFDDTINEVEMVLANGDVVKASPTERADLFRGAAGAVGTLGITTLIELQLIEAKKYVKTTYHRTRTYGADTLPTVYDKVKVDVNARAEELKQWRQRLKATWPLAGLWGIWKSIQSKDYKLHRNAEWKFNKERDA
ncbi:Cell division control protein 42-like protein [Verticillium dahliae VDG1]|nr:Cell division control protein 42-like protein [Verticillium dahliae VDG1]